jgi:hypothetical protein
MLVLALAAAPAAADVYKWIDREGKVHYGDTPPPNSAARPVDVRKEPLVSVPGATQPGESAVKQQGPTDSPARKAPEPAPAAPAPEAAAPAPVAVRGMSFDTYIMLRQGMTEGELLQRAGPPDYESNDGTVGSSVITGRRRNRVQSSNNLEIRKFYYYPTASDPFTTVVTLTGGLIADLQRTRQF